MPVVAGGIVLPVFTIFVLVSKIALLDEIKSNGSFGGVFNLAEGAFEVVLDVIDDWAVEEAGLLGDDGHFGADLFVFEGTGADFIDEDLSLLRGVDVEEQICNGGFAGARLTDNGDSFPGFDEKGEALEEVLLAVGIPEVYVFELDAAGFLLTLLDGMAHLFHLLVELVVGVGSGWGVTVVEFFLVLFYQLEVLGCSKKAIGQPPNKLNIGSSLHSRKHHRVNSNKRISKFHVEVLADHSRDVVDQAYHKGDQTLGKGHRQPWKNRISVGHLHAVILLYWVGCVVVVLQVEGGHRSAVDYRFYNHFVGIPQNFVWVLAQSCQEFVLEHACHNGEGDEKQGNDSYLPTVDQGDGESDNQGGGDIGEAGDGLGGEGFGVFGGDVDEVDEIGLAPLVDLGHFHADSCFEGGFLEDDGQILANLKKGEFLDDDHDEVENGEDEEEEGKNVALLNVALYLCGIFGSLNVHADVDEGGEDDWEAGEDGSQEDGWDDPDNVVDFVFFVYFE